MCQLDARHEALIVQLLSEAVDLVELVAGHFPEKGARYYFESFFLVLRQMGYFFTQKSSPLKSQVGSLSPSEADIATRVIAIRDAIGHRESENNFASPHLILSGGTSFGGGDVEIQYGRTKVWLLKDLLVNHRKYRDLFKSASELSGFAQHPIWDIDESRLSAAEALLVEKLRDPGRLLRHLFRESSGHAIDPGCG